MHKILAAAALAFATTAFAADPPKPAAAPAAPAAPAKDAAAAAPAAPAAPPPPAAELTGAMKMMEGKWKCEGKMADSPFGKGHPTKGEFLGKADLGGYWHVSRYEEKKTKENPTPYVMSSSVGFDPSKKQLVRTDIDNVGMVTHLASKGWEGNTIVWAGELMGPQKMTFKETITKKSDKELALMLEMAGPDGKFATLMENACKK